jgi:tape measure domain-containing protein
MAYSAGEIKTLITADDKNFQSAIKRTNKSLVGVEKNSKKVSSSTKNLFTGFAVTGAVVALGKLSKGMINLAGEAEQTQITFATLLGSDVAGSKLFKSIKRLGAETPFTTNQLLEASKTLLAFGIAGDKVVPTLTRLGNIASATGGDVKGLALVFAQIQSTGRLLGQDLNQLIGRGFNPLQEISKKTGKSMAQLKKEMAAGAISAKDVEDAIIGATSAGGKFYNLMQKQSGSLNGQLSTLKSNLQEVGANLAKVAVPALKAITGQLNKAAKALSDVSQGQGTTGQKAAVAGGVGTLGVGAAAALSGPIGKVFESITSGFRKSANDSSNKLTTFYDALVNKEQASEALEKIGLNRLDSSLLKTKPIVHELEKAIADASKTMKKTKITGLDLFRNGVLEMGRSLKSAVTSGNQSFATLGESMNSTVAGLSKLGEEFFDLEGNSGRLKSGMGKLKSVWSSMGKVTERLSKITMSGTLAQGRAIKTRIGAIISVKGLTASIKGLKVAAISTTKSLWGLTKGLAVSLGAGLLTVTKVLAGLANLAAPFVSIVAVIGAVAVNMKVLNDLLEETDATFFGFNINFKAFIDAIEAGAKRLKQAAIDFTGSEGEGNVITRAFNIKVLDGLDDAGTEITNMFGEVIRSVGKENRERTKENAQEQENRNVPTAESAVSLYNSIFKDRITSATPFVETNINTDNVKELFKSFGAKSLFNFDDKGNLIGIKDEMTESIFQFFRATNGAFSDMTDKIPSTGPVLGPKSEEQIRDEKLKIRDMAETDFGMRNILDVIPDVIKNNPLFQGAFQLVSDLAKGVKFEEAKVPVSDQFAGANIQGTQMANRILNTRQLAEPEEEIEKNTADTVRLLNDIFTKGIPLNNVDIAVNPL